VDSFFLICIFQEREKERKEKVCICRRERFLMRGTGHLEKEVSRGRIQFYGISSNNFPTPDSEPRHVSLARIMAIVKER
jgi:hypothetical protein